MSRSSERRRSLEDIDLPREIREALERFVERVRDELGDAEIYLFGSFARGDWLLESDLDLVVVSSRYEGRELGERYLMTRSLLPENLSVELLLYTPEEFRRALRRSIVLRDASRYWIKLL